MRKTETYQIELFDDKVIPDMYYNKYRKLGPTWGYSKPGSGHGTDLFYSMKVGEYAVYDIAPMAVCVYKTLDRLTQSIDSQKEFWLIDPCAINPNSIIWRVK